jgi:flagellar basal body rod protein FlgG
MGWKIKQRNGSFHLNDETALLNDVGDVNTAITTVTAKHCQLGPLCITTLTLNNVAQAVVNGTEYQGTKLYDFPQCRLSILGVTATLQQKTTSAIASTLNSGVTGAISLGTATASNVSLTSTMVDLLPSTAFTSSTTINVAGTAVTAALAAAAQFDGTSTAKDMFLNTAYATTTDVDANATQTISGTIVITWINLGDL